MHKDIDLTSPHLGSELLKDPKGDFPLDVWETYCTKALAHLGPLYPLTILSWRIDPCDPKTAALDPQQAVDEARIWAVKTLMLLQSNQPGEALESVKRTVTILVRGSSFSQPKRGAPASIRPIAVRGWIIRKFNPTLSWAKLADKLFIENGKCPRKIRDSEGDTVCGLSRHRHDSDCVKALITAVRSLQSAMKDEHIPV
jgi:hypothetical protein